jgi:hypothetical protein
MPCPAAHESIIVAQRVLVRAAHATHSPLHTCGRAAEQPAERTSLGCQLGSMTAKTNRQKTATLQRPLSLQQVPRQVDVSHTLPLVPPTHGHTCMLPLLRTRALLAHALATARSRPTARPRLLSLLRPWCSPVPWGPPAPHETLAIWRTCCNIRLKLM